MEIDHSHSPIVIVQLASLAVSEFTALIELSKQDTELLCVDLCLVEKIENPESLAKQFLITHRALLAASQRIAYCASVSSVRGLILRAIQTAKDRQTTVSSTRELAMEYMQDHVEREQNYQELLGNLTEGVGR